MKKIIIISEKPSITQKIAAHIACAWPDSERIVLHTMSLGATRFKYPRGLHWQDYPNVSEPRYELNPGHTWAPVRISEAGEVLPAQDLDPLAALRNAAAIVSACDPDHTGAMAVSTTLHAVRGRLPQDFPALAMGNLDKSAIDAAFTNMAPFPAVFAKQLQYGETKRYFDWNWNVNALAILGRTLMQSGVPAEYRFISKFALQLLFYVAANPAKTEGRLYADMSKWIGSGKQLPSRCFGSVTSRAAIVGQLAHLGFIEKDPRGAISVSTAGSRFLASLHKDCQDPDLPSRLDSWCHAGLDISKKAIDRYIKTFFGKQMRHLARYAIQ